MNEIDGKGQGQNDAEKQEMIDHKGDDGGK